MESGSEQRVLRVEQPIQVTLFETDEDGHYTNTIDLYDIAPRFVFFPDGTRDSDYLKSIRREFKHGGFLYRLLLRPGRIVRADGTEREQFPGDREQIIEAVILRLATDRGKLSVHNERVRLSFSLYEIRAELKKIKHTFALDEIKDALTILHTANVEVTRVDKKTTQILSSTSFPVLGLRRRLDEERSFLEFNPLVENAIKQLRYRRINYDWMMAIPQPLARWLYKRMCQTLSGSEDDGHVLSMTALEIARDGGMAPRSRLRDTLRYAHAAVEILHSEGIIERAEPHLMKEGRKNVDMMFDLVPTPKFMAELEVAARLAADARRRLSAAGGSEVAERFLPVDRRVSVTARNERRQLALAVS